MSTATYTNMGNEPSDWWNMLNRKERRAMWYFEKKGVVEEEMGRHLVAIGILDAWRSVEAGKKSALSYSFTDRGSAIMAYRRRIMQPSKYDG